MANVKSVQDKSSATGDKETGRFLHKLLQVIKSDLQNNHNKQYAKSVLQRVGLGIEDD